MDRPTSPGEYIRESILAVNGWTQLQLAEKLGVTPSAISMAISGERHLAPGLILRLSSLTGKQPQFWIDLQEQYSSWANSDRGKADIKHSTANKTLQQWEERGYRLLVDHEIKTGIDIGLLSISDFHQEALQTASYDLRIGEVVLGTDGTMCIPEGETIEIPPGQIATLESLERLKLSDRIAARVGPPTKMTTHFLFYSIAPQIDPGYEGTIIVSVKNEGKHPVQLIRKETDFLTVEFFFLPQRPERTITTLRTPESLPQISNPINRDLAKKGGKT